MRLVLIAVLFLTASSNLLFAQRLEYVNRYHFQVFDTLIYEYAFYKIIHDDSASYKSQLYKKDNDVKIHQYILIKDENGDDKSELSLRFFESGKLKSNHKIDFTSSEDLCKEYYENGKLKSEVLKVRDEVVREEYYSEEGDVVAKPIIVEGVPRGGLVGWNNYLAKTLRYPIDARIANQEGRVFISFELSASGEIINPQIANPEEIYPSLGKEALRAVKTYPYKWTPYTVNGKSEKSITRLPVLFKLTD